MCTCWHCHMLQRHALKQGFVTRTMPPLITQQVRMQEVEATQDSVLGSPSKNTCLQVTYSARTFNAAVTWSSTIYAVNNERHDSVL